MADDYDYESLGESSSMMQNAMAGALAGIAEHTAMYPVDSIKTRMQAIQNVPIHIKGSFSSALTRPHHDFKTASRHLWRGVSSVVLGAGPAHALYFATYEYTKEWLGNSHPLNAALAGACATLAHDTLMNPFDVVKQRMQLRNTTYRSISECARKVYAKEGLTAFYISLPTTLAMSIPFQSVQFATYEYFRRRFNPQGAYDPKTHMAAGALAGAIASSVTIPLDVVKTILQTRGQSSDPRVRATAGIRMTVAIIYERYGIRGFFRGFRPRVLTHIPSAAISWSVYEYFKWFLEVNSVASAKQSNDRSLLSL